MLSPSWLTFLSLCVSQMLFILAHRHLMPHQTAAASLARAPTHTHSRTPHRNLLIVAIGQSRSLRTRTVVFRRTLAPNHGSNSPISVFAPVRTTSPALFYGPTKSKDINTADMYLASQFALSCCDAAGGCTIVQCQSQDPEEQGQGDAHSEAHYGGVSITPLSPCIWLVVVMVPVSICGTQMEATHCSSHIPEWTKRHPLHKQICFSSTVKYSTYVTMSYCPF